MFETETIVYLPSHSDGQDSLIIFTFKHFDSEIFNANNYLALAFYVALAFLDEEKDERKLSLICDLRLLKWDYFDSVALQVFIDFFSRVFPISSLISKLIIYNGPWWLNVYLNMSLPSFISKKLQYLGDLKKIFNSEIIPTTLGGSLSYNFQNMKAFFLSRAKNRGEDISSLSIEDIVPSYSSNARSSVSRMPLGSYLKKYSGKRIEKPNLNIEYLSSLLSRSNREIQELSLEEVKDAITCNASSDSPDDPFSLGVAEARILIDKDNLEDKIRSLIIRELYLYKQYLSEHKEYYSQYPNLDIFSNSLTSSNSLPDIRAIYKSKSSPISTIGSPAMSLPIKLRSLSLEQKASKYLSK